MNRYEIRVVGHLDARRAHALGAEECRQLPDGDSILVVSAIDQAATYGLLARFRDAGLELVSIVRISRTPRIALPRRQERVEDRDGRDGCRPGWSDGTRSCANGTRACGRKHGTSGWPAKRGGPHPRPGASRSMADRRIGAGKGTREGFDR